MKILQITTFSLAFAGLTLASCSNMTRTQKGAAIGVGAGAAMGAIIGKAAKNPAMGAIVGAAVGGAAGAIIGKKMDKQAEEIKNEVAGAKVERVDEGIVVEFNSAVLFGFDQSSLTAKSQSTLDDLITILNKYPDTNLEIQGHTDSRGTDEYNLGLSQKRATAASGYLDTHGIASSRMKTVGMGESYPKYDNNTVDGQAQNRRVEFLITANEKMKQDAEREAQN